MDSIKFLALLKSVEEGSLTKAADNLGYTQAGLTHMMNRLEKEIGVTLLQRTKSGVRLTVDGESLLPYIKSFNEASNNLESAISNIRNNNNMVLKIASYASLTNHWLPTIISRFSKDYPNVKIEVHVASLDEITNLVLNNEMDLGFVSRQKTMHCEWVHLHNDPMFAVLPPDTKFNGSVVPVTFFEDKPFLMPTYGFDHDILNILNIHNVKPKINPTAVDDATVISMVSHGLGYSILPKIVLKGMSMPYTAKPLSPSSYRDLGIIVKSKDTMSSVAHKFVAYSKTVINEMNEAEDN